jgi:hypothetical protein
MMNDELRIINDEFGCGWNNFSIEGLLLTYFFIPRCWCYFQSRQAKRITLNKCPAGGVRSLDRLRMTHKICHSGGNFLAAY